MGKNNMVSENRKNLFLIPLEGGVIFVYLIQVLILLASLVKIRINSSLAGIIFIGSFLSAIVYTVRKSKQNQSVVPSQRTWVYYTAILLIAGIVVLYLLLWFLAIISPDLSWDGNAYHIPPISMWATHGNVYWVETPYLESIINGYPKGAEVVAYAMAMAFGNSALNAVNLVFLPLGVLGIASIACSLGTRPILSLVAGALFVLVPVNINQASTTYVDSALASSIVALTALWLNVIQTRPVKTWGWAIPFGVSVGLVISIKSTGIAFSGLALILLVIVIGKKLISEKDTSGKNKLSNWRYFISALILVGMIVAIGGGYWYIRNYFHTGSPLYPVGVTAFKHTIFPGVSVADAISEKANTPQQIINLPNIVRVLYTWLQDLPKWPVSIKGYDTRLAGMGYLWIVGCVPSVIIFIIANLKKRTLNSTGFIPLFILIASIFILTPMNWWARYTFWVYALGLPAFAWMLEIFIANNPAHRIGNLIAKTWLLTCMLLSVFEGLYCTVDAIAIATPGSFNSSPMSIFQRQTWTWPVNYLFPAMRGTEMDNVLSNGKIVGISPHGESGFTEYTGLVGQLSQPIGQRQLIFLAENTTAEEITLLGIDAIIWDASIPLPQSLTSLPHEEVAGFVVLEVP